MLIVTGTGNNTDILSAFRYAVNAKPRQLMAICMKKDSPLARLSQRFKYARFMDYELPADKDGFLATNVVKFSYQVQPFGEGSFF